MSTTAMGICHVVVPQHGHIRPGMFCVGGDSHSPTGGAFGAYMFGIGATEMLGVVVTGEIWLQVPQTIFMRWSGRLAAGVCAKDMMLAMLAVRHERRPLPGGGVLRRSGAALSMAERMTLCNMSAELGAQTGLVAPDTPRATGWPAPGCRHPRRHQGLAQRRGRARHPPRLRRLHRWRRRWRCRTARPMCARWTTWRHAHRRRLHRRLHRRQARRPAFCRARCWPATKVAAGVQLLVAPASLKDRRRPNSKASCRPLTDAGATLLPSACGACAGYGGHRRRQPP
jgi:3-isopropylmalate/(R)-2-methylmalate dehydratase large subunit